VLEARRAAVAAFDRSSAAVFLAHGGEHVPDGAGRHRRAARRGEGRTEAEHAGIESVVQAEVEVLGAARAVDALVS